MKLMNCCAAKCWWICSAWSGKDCGPRLRAIRSRNSKLFMNTNVMSIFLKLTWHCRLFKRCWPLDRAKKISMTSKPRLKVTTALPEDEETWTEANKATSLLADLMEWHRREDKSAHWEYYHRCDFSDEEFITDRTTLGGLVYEREVEPVKKSKVHRYRFPFQDSTIEIG